MNKSIFDINENEYFGKNDTERQIMCNTLLNYIQKKVKTEYQDGGATDVIIELLTNVRELKLRMEEYEQAAFANDMLRIIRQQATEEDED